MEGAGDRVVGRGCLERRWVLVLRKGMVVSVVVRMPRRHVMRRRLLEGRRVLFLVEQVVVMMGLVVRQCRMVMLVFGRRGRRRRGCQRSETASGGRRGDSGGCSNGHSQGDTVADRQLALEAIAGIAAADGDSWRQHCHRAWHARRGGASRSTIDKVRGRGGQGQEGGVARPRGLGCRRRSRSGLRGRGPRDGPGDAGRPGAAAGAPEWLSITVATVMMMVVVMMAVAGAA